MSEPIWTPRKLVESVWTPKERGALAWTPEEIATSLWSRLPNNGAIWTPKELVSSIWDGYRPPGVTSAFRAFSADSPWNKRCDTAPVHPQSDQILEFLMSQTGPGGYGKPTLTGTKNNTFGTPQYWASTSDPIYNIAHPQPGDPDYDLEPYNIPNEFSAIYVPVGLKPGSYDPRGTFSDNEVSIWNLDLGYVAWLYNLNYYEDEDRYTCRGGSIAYLDGNGVNKDILGGDSRNGPNSHRGLNGALVAYRWDEYQAGAVDHAIRVGIVNTVGAQLNFKPPLYPMDGSDGQSLDPLAIPHGARIRLKSATDISGLHPEAIPLAKALKEYGMIVSDSAGTTEIKCELFVAPPGETARWTMGGDALFGIPLTEYEVIDYSYDWRNARDSNKVSISSDFAPPSIPLAASAVPGADGEIIVTWLASQRATSYELRVDGTVVSNITNTEYIHSGLEAGSDHTYQVRAVNALGTSFYTILFNGTVAGVPPIQDVTVASVTAWTGGGSSNPILTAPAGTFPSYLCAAFVSILDPDAVFITPSGWTLAGTQIDGTLKTVVFIATGVSTSDQVIFPVSGLSTSRALAFISFKASKGTLDGFLSAAEGVDTVTAHKCPDLATTVAGSLPFSAAFDRSSTSWSTISDYEEVLDFNSSSPDVISGLIAVRRHTNANPATAVGPELVGTNASSTATMFSLGVEAAMPPPSGLSAVLSAGSVTVTWDAYPDATTYEVQRSLSEVGGYESLGIVGTNSFVDNTVESGVLYFYRVGALTSVRGSTWAVTKVVGVLNLIATASWTGSGSSTVPTITVPTGVGLEDRVYVFAQSLTTTEIYSTPVGWTFEGSVQDGTYNSQLFSRDGLLSGDVLQFPTATSSANKSLALVAFTGAHAVLDGKVSAGEASGGTTDHQTPSVTTEHAGTRLLSAAFDRSSLSWTILTAEWVEKLDFVGVESSACSGSLAFKTDPVSPGLNTGAVHRGSASTSTAVMWTIGIRKA